MYQDILFKNRLQGHRIDRCKDIQDIYIYIYIYQLNTNSIRTSLYI